GLDLAPGREPPVRVPQGGAAESRGLPRQEGQELQVVLREGRPGLLPVQVAVGWRRRAASYGAGASAISTSVTFLAPCSSTTESTTRAPPSRRTPPQRPCPGGRPSPS